jgi:hypothetical protein
MEIKEGGWAGHVARMGERRIAHRIIVGNLEGRDHSEGLGVDGRIDTIGMEGKVKVNLTTCLIKHHFMKACGKWRYSSTHS